MDVSTIQHTHIFLQAADQAPKLLLHHLCCYPLPSKKSTLKACLPTTQNTSHRFFLNLFSFDLFVVVVHNQSTYSKSTKTLLFLHTVKPIYFCHYQQVCYHHPIKLPTPVSFSLKWCANHTNFTRGHLTTRHQILQTCFDRNSQIHTLNTVVYTSLKNYRCSS